MHLQLEGEAWRHVVQDLTGVEELHLEIAVDGRFEREDLLAVTAAAPIIKSRVESTRRDLDRGWKRTPLPLISRARTGGKANLQTLADDHFQRQVGLVLDVDDDIVVLAAFIEMDVDVFNGHLQNLIEVLKGLVTRVVAWLVTLAQQQALVFLGRPRHPPLLRYVFTLFGRITQIISRQIQQRTLKLKPILHPRLPLIILLFVFRDW